MKKKENSQSFCVAAATVILGDKWTPKIIHALSKKVMRFCELQESVVGINPRTLSNRLSRLEEEEIITKEMFIEVPVRSQYQLSQKGKDLLPILKDMVQWGKKYGRSEAVAS